MQVYARFLLLYLLCFTLSTVDALLYNLSIGYLDSEVSNCTDFFPDIHPLRGNDSFRHEMFNLELSLIPTVDGYVSDLQMVNSYNLTAVIGDYNSTIGQITNELRIPYIIPNSTFHLGDNVFFTSINDDNRGEALRLFLKECGVTLIVVIQTFTENAKLNSYLGKFSNLTLTAVVIDPADTMEEIQTKLKTSSTLSANYQPRQTAFLIFLFNSENEHLVEKIMEAGIMADFMQSKELWMLISDFLSSTAIQPFRKFRNVNARLVFLSDFPDIMGVLNSTSMENDTYAYDFNNEIFCVESLYLITEAVKKSGVVSGEAILRTMRNLMKDLQLGNISIASAGHNSTGGNIYVYLYSFLQSDADMNSPPTVIAEWHYAQPTVDVFDLRYTLKRNVVRAGYVYSPPDIYIDKHGDLVGSSVEIFHDIGQRLNIEFQYIHTDGNEIGAPINNTSQYSGLFGKIQQGKVQVSLNPIYKTMEHKARFKLSPSIIDTGFRMVAKIPGEQYRFFTILEPYEPLIWISIVIIYLLLTVTLYSTDKLVFDRAKFSNDYTWGYSFFLSFTSLIITKLDVRPKGFAVRIFALFLWFSALMFIATYTAQLVACLSYPYVSILRIPTKTELLRLGKGNKYRWFWDETNNVFQAMNNNSNYKDIVKYAQTGWSEFMFSPNDSETISRLTNQYNIFICSKRMADYLVNQNCDLHIVGTLDIEQILVFGYSKEWSYGNSFDQVVGEMIDSSEVRKIYGLWGSYQAHCPSITLSIDITHIFGIFVLTAVGIIISLIIVIIEVFHRQCRFCVLNLKKRSFKFRKVYVARVTKKTMLGIWVHVNHRPTKYFISNQFLNIKYLQGQSADELGIENGSLIHVIYMGKDPMSGNKLFVRFEPINKNERFLKAFLKRLKRTIKEKKRRRRRANKKSRRSYNKHTRL